MQQHWQTELCKIKEYMTKKYVKYTITWKLCKMLRQRIQHIKRQNKSVKQQEKKIL